MKGLCLWELRQKRFDTLTQFTVNAVGQKRGLKCLIGDHVFLCCSVCWFLYGPFCHFVPLNLYIYIVYNILSLNIFSIYIIPVTLSQNPDKRSHRLQAWRSITAKIESTVTKR